MSQPGPSTPNHLKMSAFTIPHSGLSIHRKERIVGIDGAAQASRNSTDSHRTQRASWRKNPERPSAMNIFRFTATSRKTTVLTIVEKKTGSWNSFR